MLGGGSKAICQPSNPHWQVSGESAWTSRQDLMIPQAAASHSGSCFALLCMILYGCFWEAVIPEVATPTSHSSMSRCLLVLWGSRHLFAPLLKLAQCCFTGDLAETGGLTQQVKYESGRFSSCRSSQVWTASKAPHLAKRKVRPHPNRWPTEMTRPTKRAVPQFWLYMTHTETDGDTDTLRRFEVVLAT